MTSYLCVFKKELNITCSLCRPEGKKGFSAAEMEPKADINCLVNADAGTDNTDDRPILFHMGPGNHCAFILCMSHKFTQIYIHQLD